MIPVISHIFLQQYWWIIISLMGSVLVFLMFVQGGQSMLFTLPSDNSERTLIINSLGRKWEFTFTTLVTYGGTFFASFPLFYATSFGGAYWLWTVILFSFIIQAVSYEFRSKAGNIIGQKTFDIFLFTNGSLGPFLIGVAVGTFFTGVGFTLNEMNQVSWNNDWRGLEALGNIRNIALGLAVLFLVRLNGLLFLLNTIDNDSIRARAAGRIIMNSLFFLVFFLYFMFKLLVSDGYFYTNTGAIEIEEHKYLHNFIEMPFVMIIFLAGVLAVVYGIFKAIAGKSNNAIWFTGSGTVTAVMGLFLIAGFNNTAFYPSVADPEASLTIVNASSSLFTLKTMMFFSFTVPFIIAYIWYTWKALTSRKITIEEMQGEGHKY
ncbi:MAG TPA: cytochrome d ubiquinol oxidase subunit II [Bacteroidales bacterium]|nr:cytochrome d ubiquinol oxidase subunit II [Bacteroidales bacterium]